MAADCKTASGRHPEAALSWSRITASADAAAGDSWSQQIQPLCHHWADPGLGRDCECRALVCHAPGRLSSINPCLGLKFKKPAGRRLQQAGFRHLKMKATWR